MTSTTVRPAPALETPARPGAPRRVALLLTAFLAAALPAVWGTATALQLATGVETEHRFHQLTGQGLLLCALWLWPVLSLARAGLRGRRPSTAAGLHHLALIGTGLAAGLLAPDGGGGFAGIAVTVTGALLWAALPLRPRLRPASLDVVLAPLALLAAALVSPFVVGELDAQRAMLDEHAELAHYFDMAWIALLLVAMTAVAALSPAARRLAVPAGAGLALLGASRWALEGDATWSIAALVLGAAAAATGARRSAA